MKTIANAFLFIILIALMFSMGCTAAQPEARPVNTPPASSVPGTQGDAKIIAEDDGELTDELPESTGEAYAAETPKQNTPEPSAEYELPTLHREGYIRPEITFITAVPSEGGAVSMDAGSLVLSGDPDAEYYNPEKNMTAASNRELAYDALQCLYDMTGWQPEKCYAFSIKKNSLLPVSLSFSLSEDGYLEEMFFFASIDRYTKLVRRMTIIYKQAGAEYSPIDAEDVIRPPQSDNMSAAEIVKWYYENSAFGDRQAVVEATDDNGCIRLRLTDGSYCGAALLDGFNVPVTFDCPHI